MKTGKPLLAHFEYKTFDDEIRAGETGPGSTKTGIDAHGNPETIFDAKDTEF
jgi:hypothetical protein